MRTPGNWTRGWPLAAALAWTGLAQAAPTHQLVRSFEASAGGQIISLPAGTEVEASPGDGKSFMVRHTLPGGSTTLLFIPVESLRILAKPAATPAPPVAATPPVATATPKPAGIRLTTSDGRTVEGRILRVEKRYVVVWNGHDDPEDLPLKSLDKPSQDLVARWKSQSGGKPPEADPRVVPGKKFSLTFPNIGESRSSNPAKIQIHIPDHYQPGKPVPLALFLGGGEGGDNCDALNDFVNTQDWVTVAFPYPASAPRPLHAFREGKSRDLIEFQEPMLERLQALLPNTEPRRRVVVGSSNGAHMIGIASCDGWKEFAEYFSAFVLHEGGGSASWDFNSLRRKNVFVLMGGKSESLDFARAVVTNIEKARIKPEVFVAPDEGHGMGNGSRAAIRDWIAKLPAK